MTARRFLACVLLAVMLALACVIGWIILPVTMTVMVGFFVYEAARWVLLLACRFLYETFTEWMEEVVAR